LDQGLPCIIAGGYNCEIWELEPTGIAEFLGTTWMTPRGPVPGGNRQIDLVLASAALRDVPDVHWGPNSPWASPRTGFRISLAREAFGLQVRVLATPLDYSPAMGPDRPWIWHVSQAQPAIAAGLRQAEPHRSEHVGSCAVVDELYAEVCVTAEEIWAARQGVDLEQLTMRRVWPIHDRMTRVAPTKPEGWGQEDMGLVVWYALHNRIVNYNGLHRRGRAELLGEAQCAVQHQLQRVQQLPESQVVNSVAATGETAWSADIGAKLQSMVRGLLDKLGRVQLRKGRRKFQSWIQDYLKKGGSPPQVHRQLGDSPAGALT
jgi:hypothetical protein